MCRERDADFHVPARDLPSGYRALYCRRCIGEFMITEAVFSRGSDAPRGAPAAIEYEVLSPTREPGNCTAAFRRRPPMKQRGSPSQKRAFPGRPALLHS